MHVLQLTAAGQYVAPCKVIHMNNITDVLYKHINLFFSCSLTCSPMQGLGRFEELEELDISENDLVFLPPSIGQLLYLRDLNVSKNSEFHRCVLLCI